MEYKHKQYKKQQLKENFESDYEGDQYYDEEPKTPTAPKGTYTKPMVTANLAEAFDKFREGMDKLTDVYTLLSGTDSELHRKINRFGDAMTQMLVGLSKIIEEQGGSIETTTKPKGLQHYLGQRGLNALGLNENKKDVFDTRVELNIDRIKTIINKNK